MFKQTRSVLVVLIVLLSAISVRAQFEPCGLPGMPACTPTPGPGQPADDRDGDGVADFVDNCPDQPGTGFTNGCPEGGGTPAPNIAAPLIFPESGECLIGSFANVNVRVEPSTNSAIKLILTPGNFLWALYIVINDEGEAWYYTLVDGYVRTDVVQNNGHCDDLTTIRTFTFAADLGIPPIDPAANPPPDDPGCYYWVIYQGNVVCLLSEPLELGASLPGMENAPPPDDGFCEYQVIIDGNAICIIDDAVDLVAAGVPQPNIPPVGDPTCYRLVIHDGNAYCLVTIPPVFTSEGGSTNNVPPPDPDTCYYWVVVEGNAICLVTIEPNFAADLGDGEAQGYNRTDQVQFAVAMAPGSDCALLPARHPFFQGIVSRFSAGATGMGDPIPTEGCALDLFVQFASPNGSPGVEEVYFTIMLENGPPSEGIFLFPPQAGQPGSTALCKSSAERMQTVCNTL